MPTDSFDCVIVGARCAGSPLAVHLALAGMKVCVVDAARLPSDQALSTHAITPTGMDLLDELGLGDAVRAIAPAVKTSRFELGAARLDMRYGQGRAVHCPRRSRLDPLLQEAAVAAGAELRDESTVTEVLRDGARVTGVRVRHRGGHYDLRAGVVVGADGRNSKVARLVDAAEYHVGASQRGAWWSYWPVPAGFDALGFGAYISLSGRDARFFFHTDSGLLIMGGSPEAPVARGFADDPERKLRAYLAGCEVTRALSEGNALASRVVGVMKLRFFFRVPVGAGWALVGDAGLHKDPTPGFGITDALRDAKALSVALIDGRPEALEVYWRARDVASVPLFAQAGAMGSLDYANPFNELVFKRVSETRALDARVAAVLERELSPFEMVQPWRVVGWAGAALLTGRFELWSHMVKSAKLGAWVDSELGRRRKLLDEAHTRIAALGPTLHDLPTRSG